MVRFLRPILYLILGSTAAEAQGTLSQAFSIIRREAPLRSEAGRSRVFEILRDYSNGEKLAGEWQTINAGLSDPDSFVRDQACAILATIVYLNSARPIDLPNTTR